MAVLTESELRKRLKGKDFKEFKEFRVVKGQIITPSAKSFLTENNISLKYVDTKDELKEEEPKVQETEKQIVFKEKQYKYKTVFGAQLDEKPEHMTHLYGDLLVFKDHKRIVLRGKFDSLEAKILETQLICNKVEQKKLVGDLQEILSFVRNLLRCEVLNEKVQEISLQGMNAAELREKSHHPEKYFGMGHFYPDYTMGDVVIALNTCRTLTRETEIASYEAFKGEYGQVEREDIIRALNRLSSVFWIMMFKHRTGKYS